MKIIRSSKEKNIAETKKFTCEKCGCEFECNEDEYWDKSANTLCWGTYKTYMTCCPECHKVVEINEPNYTCASTPTYTCTTIGCSDKITIGDSWTTSLSNNSTPISNCTSLKNSLVTPTSNNKIIISYNEKDGITL